MELNNITNTGTWGQQVTRLNDNFNKVALGIDTLQSAYESLSQRPPKVVDTLPQTGEANKIYRLVGTTSYSDYMYNADDLNTPILMATYDNAIEDEPTEGSNNLVKSGGVYKSIHDNTAYVKIGNAGFYGDWICHVEKAGTYYINVTGDYDFINSAQLILGSGNISQSANRKAVLFDAWPAGKGAVKRVDVTEEHLQLGDIYIGIYFGVSVLSRTYRATIWTPDSVTIPDKSYGWEDRFDIPEISQLMRFSWLETSQGSNPSSYGIMIALSSSPFSTAKISAIELTPDAINNNIQLHPIFYADDGSVKAKWRMTSFAISNSDAAQYEHIVFKFYKYSDGTFLEINPSDVEYIIHENPAPDDPTDLEIKKLDGLMVNEGRYHYTGPKLLTSEEVSAGDVLYIKFSNLKPDGTTYYVDCGLGYYAADDTRIDVVAIKHATAVTDKVVKSVIPANFSYLTPLNWNNAQLYIEYIILSPSVASLDKRLDETDGKIASVAESLVPSFYSNASKDALNRIAQWQSGAKKFMFPIISDIHRSSQNIDDYEAYKQLSWLCSMKNIGFNFIANLGDLGIDVQYTNKGKDFLFKMLNDFANEQGNAECPVIFACGNHDTYISDADFSHNVLKEYMQSPSQRKHNKINIATGKMYGYYDDDKFGVRTIFLDNYNYYNYQLGSDQLVWLRDLLLSTPSGYSIVIVEHVGTSYKFMWTKDNDTRDPTQADFESMYSDVNEMVSMLKDFVNRRSGSASTPYSLSWDFSSASAFLVGTFAGHSHFDYAVKEDGLNELEFQSMGKCSASERPSWITDYYSFDNLTQTNVDIVCIDPTARKFKVFKMGVASEGHDVEYTY